MSKSHELPIVMHITIKRGFHLTRLHIPMKTQLGNSFTQEKVMFIQVLQYNTIKMWRKKFNARQH